MQRKFTFQDILRVIFVFLGAIAQVLMGLVPGALGWEYSIGDRSYEAQTLVVPAGYAFAIWGLLFLGCLLFAIYQALPAQWTNATLRSVGWLAGTAFWMNALWELYVPLRGLDWGSLVIIGCIFVALILALYRFKISKNIQGGEKLFYIPLMMLAGWISVATFVNISVSANFTGFNPLELSPQMQAWVVLLIAGLFTASISFYSGSLAYAGATTWGFVAIYVINTGREEYAIAYVALILGVIMLSLVMLKKVSLISVKGN